MLDLLFALNGRTNISEFLVIYKPMNSVVLREPRDEASFMLGNSAFQIVGHTRI